MTWKKSTALLAMQVLAAAALPVAASAERTVLSYDDQLDGMRPGATPAERPSRPFAGWLAVTGCEFPVDGYFSGRVQDGAISGMAAEGHDFNWRIDEHGRFAGTLALSASTGRGRLEQWIDGRVEADRLIVNVAFGVADDPRSVCRADELVLDLGG